jgi:Uma2 family endonuclease
MAIATQRFTLDEYLAYDDGRDGRYELVNGELVPMGLGTGRHGAIIKRLERVLDDEIARLGPALDCTSGDGGGCSRLGETRGIRCASRM